MLKPPSVQMVKDAEKNLTPGEESDHRGEIYGGPEVRIIYDHKRKSQNTIIKQKQVNKDHRRVDGHTLSFNQIPFSPKC